MNAAETGHLEADLLSVVRSGVAGVSLGKVETADDVLELETQVGGERGPHARPQRVSALALACGIFTNDFMCIF